MKVKSEAGLPFLVGDFADLPAEVQSQARLCLLDLIGVAAAGSQTQLSAIIREHAASDLGSGPSSLLFDRAGRSVTPAGAALANGMTIDAFDAHDGHPLTKGHAGCGLLPALLALSETVEKDMTLAEFLFHLTHGYEVAIRCGIALHASVEDYHTSGAWVAVGAAIAGGVMLSLPANQIAHAAGIAEYHGPRSQMMRVIDYPSMLKDGSGQGAMVAVQAIQLAMRGFTGAPAITVINDPDNGIWGDVGQHWRIMEQYFKPWPVCRWAQPAMQAMLDLLKEHPIAPDQIERVTVRTFHEAVRLGTKLPRDTEEAQYAIGFPLAVAMVHGTVGPEHISMQGLADPLVHAALDKISLFEDQQCSAAFPERRYASVELELGDGRVISAPRTEAAGDAHNPLPASEIERKYTFLMESSGYADRIAPILELVMSPAEQRAKVGDLMALIR